jgi:serine/threonine protein kinase
MQDPEGDLRRFARAATESSEDSEQPPDPPIQSLSFQFDDTSPAVASLLGKSLDQYRIVERIGGGGMATVYKAFDPIRNRHVAIKILPPFLADYAQFSERFRREARLVMQLEHPNIVTIEEMREEGEYAYQVMPFFEAGSLADRLDQGPMSWEEISRLIHQIASAVDYAHHQGVVHRDVKPSNILIDADKSYCLSDFGLALIQDASVSLTGSALIGTPAYISPELAQGGNVAAQSDQYSLGIILFELATGRLPFDDSSPMAVVLKHVSQPLPSPRTLNPGVPDGVERVILKATAKKAEDRFTSVSEMNEALQKALAHAREPWSITPLDIKIPASAEAAPFFEADVRKKRPRVSLPVILTIIALTTLAGVLVLPELLANPSIPEEIAFQPIEETVLEATQAIPVAATEELDVRRRQLAPTPTTIPIGSADDIRADLVSDSPDHFDYFDQAGSWFETDLPDRAAYKLDQGRLLAVDYVAEESFTWWSYSEKESGNLYAEVSATNGDCFGKDSVGLAIRIDKVQTAGGYSLEVSCDGQWRFRRHHISGSPTDLKPWAFSGLVNSSPGATNRLAIWAYQERFIPFINGQAMEEIIDPEYLYTFGRFGLFVRSSTTTPLTASFDDFAFWHVPYIPELDQ